MSISFSSKCSKVNVDWKNATKKQQNVFSFSDTCNWPGSSKISLLSRKHSSSAVSVLTSSLEISNLTKNKFF